MILNNVKKVNLPPAVGIVEQNSIDYIRTVFHALSNGRLIVPLRSVDDNARIAAVNVHDIESPDSGGGWFHQSLTLPDSEAFAHVSFTSGTEGPPKGVLLSRTALNNTICRIQSLMQMDEHVREYIGVPVYHSFGYGRCRHVSSVGGQFYIPECGFDPKELSLMLQRGEVNALSLVPSLLRVLINGDDLLGDERLQLRWLEIGSQAMSAEEKRQVRCLFPNARIVQHYGLTEASRTTLLQIDSAEDDVLDSVGKPYGDTELMINAEGAICIRGSHVATHLIKDGELLSLFNDQSWFETSDMGELNDEGYLFFKGRIDNVVNCGGQKLSTETLQLAIMTAYVNEHPPLQGEIAVSRIEHGLYGEGFLVSYTVASAIDQLKVLSARCLQGLGVSAKSAIRYYCIDALPKTATGKVQHTQLSALYQQQLDVSDRESEPHASLKVFINILGISSGELTVDDTVSDIGIDSLQSVQLSIQLEAMLGYLPSNWRHIPIRTLVALPRQSASPASLVDVGVASDKAAPLWDGSSNRNPSDMTFWALIKEDFNTHDRDIFSQGLFALFVNRFGNWRMGIQTRVLRFPMTVLYRVLRKMAQVFCGIKLDYTVQVGRRVKLEHFGAMILGARSIGDDTIIRQNTTFGIRDMSDLAAKPTIEQGVNIGAGAVIVGNITVGRHSIIGPNCVITENLPPFSVVSVGSMVVNHSSVHSNHHAN